MAHTYNSYKASVEGANSPQTLTVNCPSGTTVLVLCLGYNSITGRAGGTPTYNSVNMVDSGQGQISQGGGETTVEVWYMLAPPTGSAFTLSVPNTGLELLFLSASCYAAGGTNNSALDLSASITGNSADGNIDITTTVDGDAIIAVLTSGFRNVPVAIETTIHTNDWGNQVFGNQYFMQGTLGLKNMAWTIDTETWEAIAIAFKEVAGAGLDYQNTGQGAMAIAGSLSNLPKKKVGAYSMTIAGSLVKKGFVTAGEYAMSIVGALIKKGFVVAGGYSMTITGVLAAAKAFYRNVGGYAMPIVGTLVKLPKKIVGGYSMTIAGVVARKLSLFRAVGGYAMTITGSLVKKGFKDVGGYAMTIVGVLAAAKAFYRAVGGYSMIIVGTLVKLPKKIVGGYTMTITGALAKKMFKSVGGFAITILATLEQLFSPGTMLEEIRAYSQITVAVSGNSTITKVMSENSTITTELIY